MAKHKRRELPEERGGIVYRQFEQQDKQRIHYRFAGPPPFFEAYDKKGDHLELAFRYDLEYGIFFYCTSCHEPHALLWRDYFLYMHAQQQSGESVPYYKVLCDGGPRLRLAKPDEHLEGRFTCIYRIQGDDISAADISV